ncbi:MAG: hypothetical protein UX27_C0028G0001 [Candidatus Azambacteria bacterium GW2011_GWA2_45_90]|uniref:Uncharacterized protein n=1 Tax=Candidatus Azambacteria bacterium GW2011_GWA2_45_90 TaxID=1618614 RepID=A0A0G1NAT9_9BACT|nr:MAG: hypothetical protein UX27_C0028G0001 [Candidatus Azambacteria bacterium GW2011_GWA2_45_90]
MGIQRECSVRMTDSYIIAVTAEKRTAPGIFGLRAHFLHNRYNAVSGDENRGFAGISDVNPVLTVFKLGDNAGNRHDEKSVHLFPQLFQRLFDRGTGRFIAGFRRRFHNNLRHFRAGQKQDITCSDLAGGRQIIEFYDCFNLGFVFFGNRR